MARPLRKLTREGVVYARREIVEAEINELEKLSDDDVASRGVVWPKNTPGFISSEALLILYETRVTLRSVKRCLKLCWKEFIGTSLSPIVWMEKQHR